MTKAEFGHSRPGGMNPAREWRGGGGDVIAAVDGRPDQKPLHPTGADGDGGNHVVISCRGFSIRLAHPRPGSLRVRTSTRWWGGMRRRGRGVGWGAQAGGDADRVW